ncbi:ArdC family protein, partial [Snodgrassella sp. CFCC 13594]|uniref:ArdC family protein n=1 Tax=Snodgrassella sp. CFCC 13594 TaxID=1775559 RepID=UPI0012E7A98E
MTNKKTPKEAQEEYAQAIADELIGMIEQGTAPWQKPWTPVQGSDVPYNHLTGRPYSGSNVLYLWMQERSDPRWLTYKQAQSVDAQVRKGEQGAKLIKLVTHAERVKKDDSGKVIKDQHGEPVKEMAKLDRPFVKGFTVFNAEQIEGLPKLERPPLPELQWGVHSPAEQILAASGANIEHRPGNRAFYSTMQDRIVLPEKAQFPDAGSYYATALHELGHWTGHPNRLDRDLSGSFGSVSYAKEELRAEIASMMINRQLGMPHDPSHHAAYVGGWVQVLKEDPMEILRASRDAQKIQDYVLAFQSRDVQQQSEP